MPELDRPNDASAGEAVATRRPALLILGPALGEIVPGYLLGQLGLPVEPEFAALTVQGRYAGNGLCRLEPFSYDAAVADALAALDAAGVERALLYGIGGGCALALRLLHDAPGRIAALVCQEPVGLDAANRPGDFYAPFNETLRLARAEGLAGVVNAVLTQPDFAASPAAGPFAACIAANAALRDQLLDLPVESYATLIVRFRDGLWPAHPPFFSVSAEWLATCQTPLLVLPGNDALHPEGIARLICETARDARCLSNDWRQPEYAAERVRTIREFLREHAPV